LGESVMAWDARLQCFLGVMGKGWVSADLPVELPAVGEVM
jgi:hypothetical protein